MNVPERLRDTWERVTERWESTRDAVADRVPDPVKRLAARAWAASARVGRRIQHSLVVFGLLFVYLVGVGLTRLLMALFARRRLALFAEDGPAAEGWQPAEGYGTDTLSRQY